MCSVCFHLCFKNKKEEEYIHIYMVLYTYNISGRTPKPVILVASLGRAVGGGFRMGNTCTPMVDSCQCMAKPIQYCKVKKFKKKKKKRIEWLKDRRKKSFYCIPSHAFRILHEAILPNQSRF